MVTVFKLANLQASTLGTSAANSDCLAPDDVDGFEDSSLWDAAVVAAAQDNFGYFFVELSDQDAAIYKSASKALDKFYCEGGPDEKLSAVGNSKFGYKRLPQKERFQFRTCGASYNYVKSHNSDRVLIDHARMSTSTEHFPDRFGMANTELQVALTEVTLLLHRICSISVASIINGIDLHPGEVFKRYVDESTLPLKKSSASVLNCYRYLNEADPGDRLSSKTKKIQNCDEHTDPGMITVLGRGTSLGLQIKHDHLNVPRCSRSDAYHPEKDCRLDTDEPDEGEGYWEFVEPRMSENHVAVLIGESLRRLSGSKLQACFHRVVEDTEGNERQNIIFELRPRVNIYEAWETGK